MVQRLSLSEIFYQHVLYIYIYISKELGTFLFGRVVYYICIKIKKKQLNGECNFLICFEHF